MGEPCRRKREGNTEVVLNPKLSLDTCREKIGGYQPFTDVTTELSTDEEQAGFEDLMTPDCRSGDCAGTQEDLITASKYYFDGAQNTYKHLSTFPDYSETNGIVLAKFKAYYGSEYTPQEYTKKALLKQATSYDRLGNQSFTNFLGEVFSDFAVEGQEQSARKLSRYVTVKIQYFQKMEAALSNVKQGCLAQTNLESVVPCLNAVHEWDLARAYFTGSMDKNDEYLNFDSKIGKFPHALGDKRCSNFKTCGITQTNDNSYSAVANIKLMNLFRVGGDYVYSGNVEGVEYIIKQIESASLVPLIQGLLRFSYKRCFQKKPDDKYMAEAAVFAHAILPHIHNCSAKSAKFIDENTKVVKNKEGKLSNCK